MDKQSIHSAINHLRSKRVAFEDGLADAENARVEATFGFHFPPDLRAFLQTALPVSGGFPNWRSESESNLRFRFLERPSRGILFDLEHNDFWVDEWGPKPTRLEEAVSMAEKQFARVPRLIPVRAGYYLPALPAAEGNPVFSVRQTDISVVSRDLFSFLTDVPVATEELDNVPQVPFWSQLARANVLKVPNLANPHVGQVEEYEQLRQTVENAGYWAKVIPLFNGMGVSLDRRQPAGDDHRHGMFWITKREFGWLVCIPCPRFYFARQAHRISHLCLKLLTRLPEVQLRMHRLPFWNFKLEDDLRREFGLVAFQTHADSDDVREAKLRSWEQIGWREMSGGQQDVVWERYKNAFEKTHAPSQAPQPSVVWDVSAIYLRDGEYLKQMEADLTLKALAALRRCTTPGEELFALDYNHPCYFFDPHGGVSGTDPDYWAIPVLPNGDSYTFLAQDFRFGILGDCVHHTMCVFGRELLDAFATDPPLIFRKPAWSFEERQKLERAWEKAGWTRLSVDQKDELWEQFDERFGFFKRRGKTDGPGIIEPEPSLTWSIASAYSAQENERAQLVTDLTSTILKALTTATRPDELLYALDALRWYEHFSFSPHRLKSTDRTACALPVFPDENYTIILSPELRFGVFGNPLEQSMCIFGQVMLDAIEIDFSALFGMPLRKNGHGCAPAS